MNKQFTGFGAFKADDALKTSVSEKILAGAAERPARRAIPKKAIVSVAACLAIAIAGAAIYNAVPLMKTKSESLVNGLSAKTDDAKNTADELEYTDDLIDKDITPAGEEPDGTGADGTGGEALGGTSAAAGDEKSASGAASTASRATSATASKKSMTAPDATKGDAASGSNGTQAAAGLLTAKEWNDNLNFSYWVNLIGQDGMFRSFAAKWGINLINRIAVTVKNGSNLVCGAKVVLKSSDGSALWSAVSDNNGKAYLFYNFANKNEVPFSVSVTSGGATLASVNTSEVQNGQLTIEVKNHQNAQKALDLMFVIDTTGSMGDELSYLQTELADIINRAKTQNGNYTTRLSVNFYRDVGDDYVVRPFPFTTDINSAVKNLMAQKANGGGDFEEAVEQALHNAIHEHEWSDAATAKLLFLVLDAPPHGDAAEKMRSLTKDAAAKGIRIIPVTASGIDKNTEFLMRAIDMATGGTYVCLTNDSGVGNGHIEPSTGESQVYKLNDLLVKIIGDYMS